MYVYTIIKTDIHKQLKAREEVHCESLQKTSLVPKMKVLKFNRK